MCNQRGESNRRILLIDDSEPIHADFRKILGVDPGTDSKLDEVEAALFAGSTGSVAATREAFVLDSAYQGRDGVKLAREACANGQPYAMAFVDVRMPPGWDGIETVGHLWEEDPYIQVVICTGVLRLLLG